MKFKEMHITQLNSKIITQSGNSWEVRYITSQGWSEAVSVKIMALFNSFISFQIEFENFNDYI